MIEWHNTDPRTELIDIDRAYIVIVKPSTNPNWPDVSIGQVEMEHSWYIHTDFYGYETVGDTWPKDWYWTLFENPIYPTVDNKKEPNQ